MAGGNIAAGLGLVFIALIIHFLVAFMVSEGATVNAPPAGCTGSGNATTCNNATGTSFFQALLQVTFTGFSGVPVVDGLYLLVVGGAFIIGVVLVAFGIVGSVFGSG